MKRPDWAGKPDPVAMWVSLGIGAFMLLVLAYVVVQGAAHGAFQ